MFRRRGPYLSPIRMMQIGVDAFRQPPPPSFFYTHLGGISDSNIAVDQYARQQYFPFETLIDTSQSKFGGSSAHFKGAHLNLDDSADWNFAGGDFTIEGWVRIETGFLPANRTLLAQWKANPGGYGWLFRLETNAIRFYWRVGGAQFNVGGGFAWVVNTWYHVTVTRSGDTFRVYVDGNLVGITTQAGSIDNSSDVLSIGVLRDQFIYGDTFGQPPNNDPFVGWLDELAIWKGVAKYTASPVFPSAEFDNTDPDYASVQALLHFNGADGSVVFTDEIGHFFNANGNAQIDTAQSKFGGSSLGNIAAGTDCVTERVLDLSVGFPDSAPDDPNYADVTLLMHMDGVDGSTVFTDEKGHAFTVVGNAQIDTAQSKFGGASALFDGVDDRITTPDHADFDMGAGDFTWEGWIRTTTVAGLGTVIAKRAASTLFQGPVVVRNGATLQFYATSNGSSWNIANGVTIGTLQVNTWHHFAVVRQGSTWMLFFGGVLVTTFTSALAVADNAELLTIGGTPDGTQMWSGWIDDIRITKGVARYSYSSDFDILINTPFTLECWCYWNGVGGNQYICGKIRSGNDANDDTHTEWLLHLANSTTLGLYYGHRGVNQTSLNFTFPPITTGVWHHVALFRDASNVIRCAVDGVVSGNTYTDGKQLAHVSKPLTIGGSETAGFASSFNGFIDELRLTPGVCRYTPTSFAAFTPPAAAWDGTDPDLANRVLLLHFDGSNGDRIASDIDVHGHPVFSARDASYLMSDFDAFNSGVTGIGRYHMTGFSRGCGIFHDDGNDKTFQFGTADFTIEFWVWHERGNFFGDVMGKRASSASFGPFVIVGGNYFSNRRLFLFMSTNGSSWNLANGALIGNNIGGGFGARSFISISRQGSSIYAHQNGVLIAGPINVGANALMSNPGVPFVIGNCADGSSPAGGMAVDDVRITKGIGLYGAASYTRPSAPYADPDLAHDRLFEKVAALLHMDGADASTSFPDGSLYENIWTPTGNAQIDTAQSVFGGASALFDGSAGSFIKSRPSRFLRLGGQGNDLTIEFWIRASTSQNATSRVMGNLNGAAYGANKWFIGNKDAADAVGTAKLKFYVGNFHASNPFLVSTTNINDGAWHHVAITRQSATHRLFIDGVQQASAAATNPLYDDGTTHQVVTIGSSDISGGGVEFTGHIEEFRITQTVARYTANFTPAGPFQDS